MYPRVEPLDEGRRRQRWIIRSQAPLPEATRLTAFAGRIQQEISDEIARVYPGADATLLRVSMPSLDLLRLDDLHAVLTMDYGGEPTLGDSDAMIQHGSFRRFDEELAIDDLQGLPAESWFFVRRARAERRGENPRGR